MDLYLLLGLIALLIVWGVMIYNKLIALKNRASNGFAQIPERVKVYWDSGISAMMTGSRSEHRLPDFLRH